MDHSTRPLPPHGQSLPPITSLTSMTDGLPPQPPAEMSPLPFRNTQPHDPRDSGNWSASKHSSGISNNGFPLHSILNAEDSPSRNSIPSSIPETPLSTRGSLQPTLPSLSQAFDPRGSVDATSHFDSRRSSVDSRMNAGMGHLQISPSTQTPYDKSQNVSRTSLASSLQQQRGISADQRLSNPLSPLSGLRNGGPMRQHPPRQAPVIATDPRSISSIANPTAENPTKGFPWAFPDSAGPPSEPQDRSSSGSTEQRTSRQNSFAASINSSLYTNDSALPAGQKRFSDDMPQTHHHSLTHPVVSSLRPGEPPNGAGPSAGSYSRTPELRVSHKMAERKRRSEMKNLFDDLNNILPAASGGKSSKWEVLTRAIEHIKSNKAELRLSSQARAENEHLRREVQSMRDEMQSMLSTLRRVDPNHHHVYGPFTTGLQPQDQSQPEIPRALPPMQNHQWAQAPSHMQGVEYGSHGFARR